MTDALVADYMGQIVLATWSDAEVEPNVEDVAALTLPHMESVGRVVRADDAIVVLAHNRQIDGAGTPDVTKLHPQWIQTLSVLSAL